MSGIVGEIVDRKEKPSLVRFAREAVENKPETIKQGRYVAKDVDYALVTAPYSKDVWKAKVSDWFTNLENDVRNERIPKEWLDHYKKSYEAWKNGQELPVAGTPIKGWGVISPAKQEELIRMNILTVELLADINDEGIRRIGMGAVELKTKAKAWLSQLNDKGPATIEIARLTQENNVLQGQVNALTDQVNKLAALVQMKMTPQAEQASEEITANDLLEEDIVEQYTKKFGKKPHHLMKPETIKQKLAA